MEGEARLALRITSRTRWRLLTIATLAAGLTACQLTDELAPPQRTPAGAAATASAATAIATEGTIASTTEAAQATGTATSATQTTSGTNSTETTGVQPTASAGEPGVTDQGIETSGTLNLRQYSDAVPGCVLNALLMSPMVDYDVLAPKGGTILLYFNRGQAAPGTMLVNRFVLSSGRMTTRNINGETSDQLVTDKDYDYIGVFSCNTASSTATLEANLTAARP